MFNLIGLIVVIIVLIVGFPALRDWYSGDATPKETVNNIRGRLSESLATDKDGNSQQDSSFNDRSGVDDKNDENAQNASDRRKEKEADNLTRMINEVNKR
jgi:hypothetical protein